MPARHAQGPRFSLQHLGVVVGGPEFKWVDLELDYVYIQLTWLKQILKWEVYMLDLGGYSWNFSNTAV